MSVYFIKVGRYLKVGYSANPERRCANLWQSTTRYSRPWDLSLAEPRELLLAIAGGKSDESRCHDALDDFRSNGEWFIDEPEVRDFMRCVGALIAADESPLPKVARPAGPFERVPWEQMLPERREENDRLLALSYARAQRNGAPSLTEALGAAS